LTSLREANAILNWHLGRARWIFIHIPKNAGVSIRKSPELAGRLVSADPYFHVSRDYSRAVRSTMEAAGEHHGLQHARWRDLRPDVTNRLQAVAVVRNPWSRTYSRWRFAQLATAQGKVGAEYAASTFEAFIEERHALADKPYYWHRAVRGWYPQTDYVTDLTGRLRTDILRFEKLDEEARQYFGLTSEIRKRNRTSKEKSDYRDAYTPATIQAIADWYASDIDMFGFDFDGVATKNTTYA
jgi:hypothetical protein